MYFDTSGSSLPQSELRGSDIFLPYQAIEGRIDAILNRWLESYQTDEFEPSINLYSAVLSQPDIYLDVKFLFFAQSLEVLHRRVSEETVMPDEEFRSIKSAMLKAVPSNWNDHFSGRLNHANEPSLRRRLRMLLKDFSELYGVNSKARESFANKVVMTRNYLTHYDKSLKSEAADDQELFDLTRKLKSLLQLHFLQLIGIDKQTIMEITRRNPSYHHRMMRLWKKVKSENLRPYTAYKPSGIDWLGDIPKHWDVRRLSNIVDMRVSNVDKHVKDDELPVRLCNYVDVYKNDRITDDVFFLPATASSSEIARFRLRVGDVLITKDSETWNDIGVPALVDYAADDLICGYHLAMLRPLKKVLNGGYLLRLLQEAHLASQFHVSANGVTRYGLSHTAIKSVCLPLPPLAEQRAIVRYLDRADERIQRAISAKERLIELLTEQRNAVIHQAVTRGLDPNVRLKDSGVEWLGDVPEHWDVRRAKYFYGEVDERSTTGIEELMSVSHITGVTPRKSSVTMFLAESNIGYKVCRRGDIAINTMWAYMAALGVAWQEGIVSPSYGVYRPRSASTFNPRYVDPLLRTETYKAEYLRRSTGITSSRLRLYSDQFLGIPLLCPPATEQANIVRYLDKATAAIDAAVANAERQIDLLGEYRTRLIADVVMGQMDVRRQPAG